MSYDEDTKEIDGLTVGITPMPFLKAMKFKRKLLALVSKHSKSFFKMFPTMGGLKEIASTEINFDGVVELLEGVLNTLDEKTLTQLIDDFCVGVVIDGQSIETAGETRDMLLAGRIGTFYKIIAFSMEVNFGSFFALFRNWMNSDHEN